MTRWSKNRKYKLLPGSELLRIGYWNQASRRQLKGLIKRFATREDAARKKAMPFLCWRRRRLRAVSVYEARFEQVPEVFRKHKLPPMKSYYVHNGRYVWPENGQPGKPVG